MAVRFAAVEQFEGFHSVNLVERIYWFAIFRREAVLKSEGCTDSKYSSEWKKYTQTFHDDDWLSVWESTFIYSRQRMEIRFVVESESWLTWMLRCIPYQARVWVSDAVKRCVTRHFFLGRGLSPPETVHSSCIIRYEFRPLKSIKLKICSFNSSVRKEWRVNTKSPSVCGQRKDLFSNEKRA